MQLRSGIRKRRTTSGASGAPSSCPVCLEDFAPDGLDAFPCAHKACKLCYMRCDTCPLCRMDKRGVSDEERRDERERMREHLAGARLIVTAVPRDRIPEFLAGGFLGETPFEGSSFTIRTQGLSAAMNAVIGDVVGDMIVRQRLTGNAPTRGQLQQATSAAMFRSVSSSSSRRGTFGTGERRAGFEGTPLRFQVQDVLGRALDLDDLPSLRGAAAERSNSP